MSIYDRDASNGAYPEKGSLDIRSGDERSLGYVFVEGGDKETVRENIHIWYDSFSPQV